MKDTAVFFPGQSSPTPYDFGRKHFARHLRRALRASGGDVQAALDLLAAAGRRVEGPTQIAVGSSRTIKIDRFALAGLIGLAHAGEVHLVAGAQGRIIARPLPWCPTYGRERMLHPDFAIYPSDAYRRWLCDRLVDRRFTRRAA